MCKKGHYYDVLEVVDPKTNTVQSLWFNADIQMNPDGLAVPAPPGGAKDSATSNVVATGQTIASMHPTPNDAGTQSSDAKSPPTMPGATDASSQAIKSHLQSGEPQTLYNQEGVSIIATETQDTLELAVSEPDPILVSVEIDRDQNGQFDRLVDVAYP